MIEKKIYRTAHIYITAFNAHFVRKEYRVRRECRHSAEWRQCAERCAFEIKVGHLKEPQHGKTNTVAYALREVLDQPGQQLRLITNFALRLKGR